MNYRRISTNCPTSTVLEDLFFEDLFSEVLFSEVCSSLYGRLVLSTHSRQNGSDLSSQWTVQDVPSPSCPQVVMVVLPASPELPYVLNMTLWLAVPVAA